MTPFCPHLQDGDNDVSCPEFIKWAQKNVASAALLDSFERLREEAEAKAQAAAKAKQKKLREERRAVPHTVALPPSLSPLVLMHTPARAPQMQRRARRAGQAVSADAEAKVRVQKRNKNRVATKHVLKELSRESELTVKELRALKKQFAAKLAGRATASLTRRQFEEIMVANFPALGTMSVGGHSACSLLFDRYATYKTNVIHHLTDCCFSPGGP